MIRQKNISTPSVNTDSLSPDEKKRRDALKKMGKFVSYAAPFTLLVLTDKAARGYAVRD